MRIIFSSLTCSSKEYLNVQNIKYREKLNPSQKYFDMLLNGSVMHNDVSISCVSARAIAHSNSRKKVLFEKSERDGLILYNYIPILNFFLVRNVFNFILGFVYTVREIIRAKEKCFFVADPLAYDISAGALLAAKLLRKKTCAVVTDLPIFMAQINKDGKGLSIKKKMSSVFMEHLIGAFDCYVFLTESMNVVNKKKKPYTIIEGMTYCSQKIVQNSVDNNVVLYAGGLFEQFGIKKLVDAAKLVDVPGFELHLYGEGLCVDYIKEVNKTYPNIKYMGTLSLDEIIKVESNAKLLINPRPSNESFTEYSFPSKTIEYMSTGRPVLTTPLKGIPEEYFSYLIRIEKETVEGFAEMIGEFLDKECSLLDSLGLAGMRFVLEEKNNMASSKKMLEMLKE